MRGVETRHSEHRSIGPMGPITSPHTLLVTSGTHHTRVNTAGANMLSGEARRKQQNRNRVMLDLPVTASGSGSVKD